MLTSLWKLTDNLSCDFHFFIFYVKVHLDICSTRAFHYYAPARREGDNKRCFCLSVCLSVRPLVAYIANNSRIQRPSVPKFGRKVPHLWCDSHTRFEVKRSKVKVTRPINTHAHRAPYLPNSKAYKLQTWYTDGGQRPESATGAMTSKVKGQGCKVTWLVWAVLAQCCTGH